eukprot:528049_1
MLRFYRKMGGLEQVMEAFSCWNNNQIPWNIITSRIKIDGLHEIDKETLQKHFNKIHAKYESLQCQFLCNKNNDEYDSIYIGCLPPDIIICQNINDFDKLFRKEMNQRFKLLNDVGLTTPDDIENGKYNIKNIPALYKVIKCDDYLIFKTHHALLDGISFNYVFSDLLCLLNNNSNFNDTLIKYTSAEQSMKDKYKASPPPKIVSKLLSMVPPSYLQRFIIFYANNSFLSYYNPLNFQDFILLATKYVFNDCNDILQFTLNKHYNKKDWKLDAVCFKLNKIQSTNLLKKCKLNNCKFSLLLQYITFSAFIECHNDILKENYYKSVLANVFSTIPMYKEPNKPHIGCHAAASLNIIEYHQNIRINSDEFWDAIRKISKRTSDSDTMFTNLLPMPVNPKRTFYETWNNPLIESKPLQIVPISNAQKYKLNAADYKLKMTEFYNVTNPGIGFGAPFMLTSLAINNVNELQCTFVFGKQFITRKTAEEIVNNLMQKINVITQTSKL